MAAAGGGLLLDAAGRLHEPAPITVSSPRPPCPPRFAVASSATLPGPAADALPSVMRRRNGRTSQRAGPAWPTGELATRWQPSIGATKTAVPPSLARPAGAPGRIRPERRRWIAALTFAAAGLVAGCASLPGPESLSVTRPDGTRAELRAATLSALPHESFEARAHDKSSRYGGIELTAVLRAAGIDAPDKLHGAALRRVVLVEAADRYGAAFGYAELDPTIGRTKVHLVDREDDAPLPAADGPWRIVVASEARPTRWVRKVVRVSVIELR